MQAAFQFAFFHDVPKRTALRVHAIDDFCTGFGVQDQPGFAFAQFSFMFCRISIVGMYLNGEIFLGVQQLQQQRELAVCTSCQLISPQGNDFR